MHSVTRTRLRRAVLLTCISAGACLLAYGSASAAPHTPALRWRHGAFNWLGTFALAGSGFPEGTRHASMTVRRDSTGYQLDVSGPPGRLASVHIAGDSAHIVWDFEAGTDPMRLALRGVGDSISGTWTIGGAGGAITGARMRSRTP